MCIRDRPNTKHNTSLASDSIPLLSRWALPDFLVACARPSYHLLAGSEHPIYRWQKQHLVFQTFKFQVNCCVVQAAELNPVDSQLTERETTHTSRRLDPSRDQATPCGTIYSWWSRRSENLEARERNIKESVFADRCSGKV